jgi:hypothetical protein
MNVYDLKSLQKRMANRHSNKAAPAPAAPAPAPAEPPAEELTMANTKAELTAAAEAAGITVEGSWTKAQILAALYPE